MDGGGFDDGVFEAVDVEVGLEPGAGGGGDQGPWPVFEELDGAGVAGADEPVGGLEGDAGHLGVVVQRKCPPKCSGKMSVGMVLSY